VYPLCKRWTWGANHERIIVLVFFLREKEKEQKKRKKKKRGEREREEERWRIPGFIHSRILYFESLLA